MSFPSGTSPQPKSPVNYLVLIHLRLSFSKKIPAELPLACKECMRLPQMQGRGGSIYAAFTLNTEGLFPRLKPWSPRFKENLYHCTKACPLTYSSMYKIKLSK